MALTVLLFAETYATAGIVDFEDLTPMTPYTGLGGGQYWNGSDRSGGFASGGAYFINSYNSQYDSWDGWSYSNTSDTTTPEYTNQYSAYTGADHSDPGKNYGVYYKPWSPSPTVTLAPGSIVSGTYVTNTTYAARSMLYGDSFAKKFGGISGNEEDWFKLTITGENSSGVTGAVNFYLADYRFQDNTLDYVVDEWTWVDLTSLGDATKFAFDLSSSDVGDWGMNTPANFALDDLSYSAVPEPGTLAIIGSGGLVLGAVSLLRRRFSRRASNG
ncbi:MAG: DUF4465 domain-containing protein [Pirellulaceae bacterium]